MKIKYSIVVPVYNTEKYIRKCLDSIKNQTYTNYEVIIINDGSTDNSLEIINEYTKNKKFKVYTTKNKGLSEARNNGVKHCTGDYILFIDSDDFVHNKWNNVYPIWRKTLSEIYPTPFNAPFNERRRVGHRNKSTQYISFPNLTQSKTHVMSGE